MPKLKPDEDAGAVAKDERNGNKQCGTYKCGAHRKASQHIMGIGKSKQRRKATSLRSFLPMCHETN